MSVNVKPRVLVINPPIYDFSAYDFWLRPMGSLAAAGMIRDQADLTLYDFLDRRNPVLGDSGFRCGFNLRIPQSNHENEKWGRGKFIEQKIKTPSVYKQIPRYFRRFGIPREHFLDFLRATAPFDFLFVQSSMTYWYPGIREVIETARTVYPNSRIILGGFYATACRGHAEKMEVDLVVSGDDLNPVWDMLGLKPSADYQPPAWELYPELRAGTIKLTAGCPFQCSYCYVPVRGEGFTTRPTDHVIADFEMMCRLGVQNIAFYDDALLYRPEEILYPFLEYVYGRKTGINLHTPNALHARLLTKEAARRMVQAGVKTFYLGFESASAEFQKKTGSKLASDELAAAVEALKSEGVDGENITAYEILGHPLADVQKIEESMRYAGSLGIQVMLSEFSPIPGTPDGEMCRKYVDLDEPLNHNKTAFPIVFLGEEKVKYYKDLCRALNNTLKI